LARESFFAPSDIMEHILQDAIGKHTEVTRESVFTNLLG
jgi:hypothetical protein